ncbi:glycoside hydrolase family 16 protein [Mycena maculata]|uniref:Glycoside hydrolase family 16 protein n=1 Tax=Mycena maculata TaxID=230809 RepID=A0AAD7HTT3_9AGAR|nr:glycoside hydrolase family 16 protein [Mycena maculata]
MKGASRISTGILTLCCLLSIVRGATYSLSDNIVGTRFYDSFTFEAIPDPTAGRVNYVNQATAQSLNLTFASADTFILRADDTTVISDSSSVGRNSVRIRSSNAYTTHVAVWETNESNWPAGGEVDIVEGVNDQGTDQVTLHTSPGCEMPATGRTMTGTALDLDCDTSVNGNAGCGVSVGQAPSFGPTFNADGGGWYAIERTTTFINVFFWSRQATDIPVDVVAGGSSVDTSNWGTPVANFPNTDCNIAEFFDGNNIIINLTFCGDWAGAVYAASGCPSTCESYVDAKPTAFVDAYFQFTSINIYT